MFLVRGWKSKIKKSKIRYSEVGIEGPEHKEEFFWKL
jgi:hypothetical protein